MGVMNRMRGGTKWVLWILVFAFGGLWVLQDSGALDNVGLGIVNNIAEVNGKPVSYEQWQTNLNSRLEAYQRQTGESASQQVTETYRQQTFDQMVEQVLQEEEMDRLGVTVSDEEILEMVMGDEPDPLIVQYFGDESGQVNRTLLRQQLENPSQRDVWIQIEDYLRGKRRSEKMRNLIGATVRVSDQQVEEEYRRRNQKATADFVALRYSSLPDSTVSVETRDLRAFYNDNKEDFKQSRSHEVRYASFSKLPTAADTAAFRTELAELSKDFTAADDDSVFLLNEASDRPYNSAFFRADELDTAISGPLFEDLTVGRVVGPVLANGEMHLIKILEARPAEENSVKARHILVGVEDEDADDTEARQKADDLYRQLQNGADFAELARANSDDAGSGRLGGDLGWFGPGRMVDEFEEAAFAGRVGRVLRPVKSQFGFHIIEVQDRADREVRIADFVRRVETRLETLAQIQRSADDLQYYATEEGGLEAEAEKREVDLSDVTIEEGMTFVPGIGSSREITNFLETARAGDISPAVELDDKFVVLEVENVNPEGYRSFEDVESELMPRVRLSKKKAHQSSRLADLLAQSGGFEGLAAAAGVQQRTATDVSFSNTVIPGMGRDQAVAGTILAMNPGDVSGVIEGEQAAYVVMSKDNTAADLAGLTDTVREEIRKELTDRGKREIQSQWLAQLRDRADITDNRRKLNI